MNIFILAFLGLFFAGIDHEEINCRQQFSLIKRSEIYLYRLKLHDEPWSQNYTMSPHFGRLPTGEIFMIEKDKNHIGSGYFFSPTGEIVKMFLLEKPQPMRARGRPGSLSSPANVFTNSSNEFGTYDHLPKRINLWNANGKLNRSFIIPKISFLNNKKVITSAAFDHKILALGYLDFSEFDQTNMIVTPSILLYDFNNYLNIPINYPISKDSYNQALSKGAAALVTVNVNILLNDKVACNVSDCHEVYLITKKGAILIEDTVPSHFRSIGDATPIDELEDCGCPDLRDDEGHMPKELEEWVTTWTHSYPVYEYTNNKLIVPRVLHPMNYLDLYYYSDTSLSYIGYAEIDKRFLFADSSGVYVLEGKDDTSVVIGKYEIVTTDYRKNQGMGWVATDLSSEQLAGIRKVSPDTSKPCPDCPREKYKPKRSKINKLKLLSPDSVAYFLIDSLNTDKEHVILFGPPQDWRMSAAFDAAKKYCSNDSANYDLTVVYTHPYPVELKWASLLTQVVDLTLVNLDEKRLVSFIENEVTFLVVSKDGTIVASANYPGFEPKPR